MSTGFSIYLDDCADDEALAAFLRQAGHSVGNPRVAGTRGFRDREHLEYACRNGHVLLTYNAADFRELHEEWQTRGSEHPGILLVCLGNDAVRDPTHRDIVRAIGNLIASGIPLANDCHVLNHWQ